MIGFRTEFGLRKERGRIALTLAKTSKGQPQVTRSGLGVSPSVTGNQANPCRNLPILGQSEGSRAGEIRRGNPVPPGFRSSRGVFGSVFSGSV